MQQVTIMNTTTRSNTAERFGRWLGRGWRGYVRRERRVVAWLASAGVPTGAATVLVWIVKLVGKLAVEDGIVNALRAEP